MVGERFKEIKPSHYPLITLSIPSQYPLNTLSIPFGIIPVLFRCILVLMHVLSSCCLLFIGCIRWVKGLEGGGQGCFFQWNDSTKSFHNVLMKTDPLVIHTSGTLEGGGQGDGTVLIVLHIRTCSRFLFSLSPPPPLL